jgi:hypothetical protein
MVIAKHDNELLLVWKDPVTRNRIAIGRLWKENELYFFRYIRADEDERGSIDFAIKMGYKPIKMFSELSKVYKSKTLFSPFLNRLNGSQRNNNPFEVLKKTGGKLNTDTLEFMRTIEEKEEQRSVSFFAAGWRYYQGKEALSELEEGQELYFKHEEDNLYDENAIEIWNHNKKFKLGYVPSVYSRYIDKLVIENNYSAYIEEILLGNDSHNILKVKFMGKMVKPKIENKDLSFTN